MRKDERNGSWNGDQHRWRREEVLSANVRKKACGQHTYSNELKEFTFSAIFFLRTQS
jgi:hypothetical protein